MVLGAKNKEMKDQVLATVRQTEGYVTKGDKFSDKSRRGTP